jgi:hypothetical protein
MPGTQVNQQYDIKGNGRDVVTEAPYQARINYSVALEDILKDVEEPRHVEGKTTPEELYKSLIAESFVVPDHCCPTV